MALSQPTDNNTSENLDIPSPVRFSKKRLHAGVTLSGDGRLGIDLNNRNLAGLLAQFNHYVYPSSGPEFSEQILPQDMAFEEEGASPLRLNIVLHVVGSRGDIQPFIAFGKSLKQYGHRVRLATHLAFRSMVMENGLEFFNIGGNPEELMMFMVKNAGLLPEFKAIRSGAIKRHRNDMCDIIHGCWRSCFETGDWTHGRQTLDDSTVDEVDLLIKSFVADAIVANPPSLAHNHCAEKLGIPLTIMLTMPWSPTQAFPHPLASIGKYSTKPTLANFMSYSVVDMLIWQGLGDIINKFRRKTLGLDILEAVQSLTLVHRLHVPHAYLSPALLSKPRDWSRDIDVCGFAFLSPASNYTPSDDLVAFLRAGSPPVYVRVWLYCRGRFGEIEPDCLRGHPKDEPTCHYLKEWGGLDVNGLNVPENIFLLNSCPHDWLFSHVSCAVHHGGAGTTAIALKLGCPTVIIPFFGDQYFWGSIVAENEVGPSPVPYKELTMDKLADAILVALEPSYRKRGRELSNILQHESGTKAAVSSFHRNLNDVRIRCTLCPSRPPVWWLMDRELALSTYAMTVLVEAGLIKAYNLKLYHSVEYDTGRDPKTPLNALPQVLMGSIAKAITDIGDVSSEVLTAISGRGHHRDCETGQIVEAEGATSEILPSLENPGAPLAHISSFLTPTCDTECERSNTRSKLQREKPYVSKFSQSLPRATAHTSRLAQGVLDIIVIPSMEISHTLSRGFHNLPLLFHDDTVREIPKVIGLRSGLQAAGKEFVFSVYDGISGLVSQPRRGMKNSGGQGLVYGIGKGIAGVISKPIAGVLGLAAYPLTGLHKYLQQSLSERNQSYIKCARIPQGISEFQCSSPEERGDVIRKWQALDRADFGCKRSERRFP